MHVPRRQFLQLAASAIAAPIGTRQATAQSYPARPVRLVVGFPPGGPNDILARLIAAWLTNRLGQPFEVDNKPGRSGNIGTELVVRAPPDGYALLLIGPANAISGSLYPNLGFNFLRDIVPVAAITREPLVMVVHPSVPAATPSEFISYAKENLSSIVMASTGNGSSPHVTGELFKQMTGLNLKVVHYGGGGPALKAMVAGEAQMMFEPISAALDPLSDNRLRALAVTTPLRSDALPDIPVLGRTVPGFEASALTGIGAPKSTPSSVVTALNKTINAGFYYRPFDKNLIATGGTPLPGSPRQFRKMLEAETEKWSRVVKKAGVKAD